MPGALSGWQMTDGSATMDDLRRYADERGVAWTDPRLQLLFMLERMNKDSADVCYPLTERTKLMADSYRYYTDEGALLRGTFNDDTLVSAFSTFTPDGWVEDKQLVPGEHAVQCTQETAADRAKAIAGDDADIAADATPAGDAAD